MPENLKHRVQMVVEGTRGTAQSPMILDIPIMGDGFKPIQRNAQGKIVASPTFPYPTDSVPVGTTSGFTMRVQPTIGVVPDLLMLAAKRTSGVLPAVTTVHDQQGVGVSRFEGSVCKSLVLEASRGGEPGEENIFSLNMEFECYKMTNGQGAIVSGLTPPGGKHLQLRFGTYTINSVAALEMLMLRIAITNALALGPVNGSDKRLYIEDGLETLEISSKQRFTTTAWRLLVENATEHAASFVLSTGVANQTITATIGKTQAETRELSETDGVVEEQIALSPFHTGSAAPVLWTFGNSVPTSTLGLY